MPETLSSNIIQMLRFFQAISSSQKYIFTVTSSNEFIMCIHLSIVLSTLLPHVGLGLGAEAPEMNSAVPTREETRVQEQGQITRTKEAWHLVSRTAWPLVTTPQGDVRGARMGSTQSHGNTQEGNSRRCGGGSQGEEIRKTP